MAEARTRTTPDAGDSVDLPPTTDGDANGAATWGDILSVSYTTKHILIMQIGNHAL